MIEIRRLTDIELYQLINEAEDIEKNALLTVLDDYNLTAYDFFDLYSIEHFGIVIDDKPIYFGALIKNEDGEHEIWTVVSKDVKEQISLFKHTKRKLKELVEKYGQLYATMPKERKKNIKWTNRLGFVPIREQDSNITFVLMKG